MSKRTPYVLRKKPISTWAMTSAQKSASSAQAYLLAVGVLLAIGVFPLDKGKHDWIIGLAIISVVGLLLVLFVSNLWSLISIKVKYPAEYRTSEAMSFGNHIPSEREVLEYELPTWKLITRISLLASIATAASSIVAVCQVLPLELLWVSLPLFALTFAAFWYGRSATRRTVQELKEIAA